MRYNEVGKVNLIRSTPFRIDPERLLRQMRVPARVKRVEDLPERMLRDLIARSIERAYQLIHPSGSWAYVQIERIEDDRLLSPQAGRLFRGDSMRKLLARSDYATLMTVTIGPELERESSRLAGEANLTESYILDAIGSLLADETADRIESSSIAPRIARAGYKTTMRYSPGYGDWPLEVQGDILRLTRADRIGVSLSESMILIPSKSVTAVIGWERRV